MRRLLLDQGMPRSSVRILRNAGWDVLHVGDAGLSTATDKTILHHAAAEGRCIVTLDSDFHWLLALSGATSPSVIRIRIEGLRGPELAALVERCWPHIEESVERGALVSITPKAIRIRNLPILNREGSS